MIITGLIIPVNVNAYIDPGTGSYLFQIVIATLLGVGYVARDKIHKIILYVKNYLNPSNDKDKD